MTFGCDLDLLAACEDGDVENVIKAINNGANVNFPDKKCGYTPMHYACSHRSTRHETVRQLLIDHGAKMDIPSKNMRLTAQQLYETYVGGVFQSVPSTCSRIHQSSQVHHPA